MNSHAELQKYLKMIIKRRYLFLFVALLVMTSIAWGSFFLPKVYESTSTVFIEKSVIKDLVKGITFTPSVEDKLRVMRYAMLSRVFVTKIIKELDLDTKAKNEKDLEKMIEELQKETKINIKGNDLFIVTYRNKDPQIATNYVNTLVQRYVEENISLKREDSFGADRFLTEQAKAFKEKLDKFEDEIVRFRQQQGVSVAVDEGTLVKDIRAYQGELDAIQIKKNELAATLSNVQKQLKTEDRFTVAVLSSRAPEGGDREIAALERQVKQLLVNYTDNYPEVVRLRGIIEALKKQKATRPADEAAIRDPELSTINPLFQNLKQQSFAAESELEAINARQRQLRNLIGQKSSELRNIPADQKKLADLIKERDAARQIYDQLMLRQGQAQLSKQMEVEDKAATYRIVDPAIVPKKPVSPNRIKLILIGIMAGVVAGFGAVFLRETLDSSIKDAQTLRSFGYEVLAVIPRMINEEEQNKISRKNRIAYTIAGGFFAVIFLLLLHEVLELTLIEHVISLIGIDRFTVT